MAPFAWRGYIRPAALFGPFSAAGQIAPREVAVCLKSRASRDTWFQDTSRSGGIPGAFHTVIFGAIRLNFADRASAASRQ
jgi:hypothetical protein